MLNVWKDRSAVAGAAGRITCAAMAVGVLMTLTACGGGKKEGATQVAAKVNSGEISVHQINSVLQRQPGLKQEQVPAASRQVLEGLIDQELALQQAVDQKLDRDPRIVLAIEGARREILARAYLERINESVSKPTEAEVHQYYLDKPELFAQRKIYNLHEVLVDVPGDAAQRQQIAEQFRDIKSADELSAKLRAAGIKFNNRSMTQAAEGLPLGLLNRLSKVSDGQMVSLGTPSGLVFLQVVGTKLAPVAEDAAKPAITAFLLNERKRKSASEEMKRLRTAAKIEYAGQFAGGASAPVAGSEPASSVEAVQAPAPAASSLDGEALQKGLSGLK